MRRTPFFGVVVLLVGALALPAWATHDPVQTLPVSGGASEVYVGLADDGVATAVWDDNGAVKAATRPSDDFFGAPQTLAPAYASDIRFDEAPNGNAVVAYIGLMSEGELIVHHRSGSDGSFGPAQVLVTDGAGSIVGFDVAASNSGNAVVVWQDTTDPLNPSIMAAISDAAGTFGAADTVHQAPNLQNPKVDMDAEGSALAVWDFTSAQAANEIQMASAPPGGPFGSVATLHQLVQGAGNPEVAVNSSGAAVVVWEDFTEPAQCPPRQTCSRDILEISYGTVNGTFAGAQMITNPTTPTATGDQEVAIDDSGKAAVLFSALINNTSALYASISDAAGNFTAGYVTVSPFNAVESSLVARNFEIAAGAGEFTAFWGNDHDQDGTTDEAWQATTSGGSFGAPHQISPDDDDSVDYVHGDRNASGETVAAWQLFVDNYDAQVTPVASGTPPEFGSESDDNFSGSDGSDIVHLLGGNDTYTGGGGADSIFGESGNDTLNGESGDDLVDGGPGADSVAGGGGNDSLLGRGGGDRLKGGTGDDTLKGGGGNDVLDGGGISGLRASGAATSHTGEVIIGGAGKDTCFKYSKNDVLKSCEIVKRKRAH